MQIYRFINWDKGEVEGKDAITPNVELIGWSADGSWLAFSPDNEKLAYIAGIGRDGVFALDRDSGDLLYELQDEGSFQYVRALLGDSQGNLWFGTHNGITLIRVGALEKLQ